MKNTNFQGFMTFLKRHDWIDNNFKAKRFWLTLQGSNDSEKLRNLMVKYKKTQYEMSKLLDVSEAAISKILSKKRHVGHNLAKKVSAYCENPKELNYYCKSCGNEFNKIGKTQFCDNCHNPKNRKQLFFLFCQK